MTLDNYYVYAHLNPVKNEIFYIGKGFGLRAESRKGRSNYWSRIVDKYGYDIVLLETNISSALALRLEEYWIKRVGRKKDGGTLINMTDGGDGGDTISNHPDKVNICKRLSDIFKGEKNPSFGSKFINEAYIKKQIISNSKKRLKVTDILTGDIYYFINSKQCAHQLGYKSSNVRMCKNKYNLGRRYMIEDADVVPEEPNKIHGNSFTYTLIESKNIV